MKSSLNTSMVYTPIDTLDTAETLANVVLEKGYAICVNIIRQAVSMYIWEGKVKKTQECLLIFKTLPGHADSLCELIRHHHPYTAPAILKINTESNEDFVTYLQKHLTTI